MSTDAPLSQSLRKLFSQAMHREYVAAMEAHSEQSRLHLHRQIRNGTAVGPLYFKRTDLSERKNGLPTHVYGSRDAFLDIGKLEVDKPIVFLNPQRPKAARKVIKEETKFRFVGASDTELYIKGPDSVPTGDDVYIRVAFQDFNSQLREALQAETTPEWPLVDTSPTFHEREIPGRWCAATSRLDAAAALALRRLYHRDNKLLDIIGPPGTGKTSLLTLAAAMMAADGLTVCITSRNHAVVNKALEDTSRICSEMNLGFRPAKSGDCDTVNLELVDEYEAKASPPPVWGATLYSLANLYDKPYDPRRRTDVLIIDEAGQIPCFQAAAIAFMAPKICLFGDPDQLPPIFAAEHDHELGTSIMGYIRARGGDVWETRFSITHRLNEEITGVTSKHYYPHSPLFPGANKNTHLQIPTELHATLGATSLCFLQVDHTTSIQHSIEEAKEVARLISDLVQHAVVCFGDGKRSPLQGSDIVVMSPHRWQVATIVQELAQNNIGGVRVGTVDKMQGQDAVVVIYSLTQSNPENIATLAEWLFEKNRLNVAITRAKAKVIVVGNRDAIYQATPEDYSGNELRRAVLELIGSFERLAPATDPVSVPAVLADTARM